jgi:hypothetical protein
LVFWIQVATSFAQSSELRGWHFGLCSPCLVDWVVWLDIPGKGIFSSRKSLVVWGPQTIVRLQVHLVTEPRVESRSWGHTGQPTSKGWALVVHLPETLLYFEVSPEVCWW